MNNINGRAYLMNGHHRLRWHEAKGKKKIRIRVKNGPYKAWKDPANR